MIDKKPLEECPACHAHWPTLNDSLQEPIESENWYLAMLIIRNCKYCGAAFAKIIKRLENDNDNNHSLSKVRWSSLTQL